MSEVYVFSTLANDNIYAVYVPGGDGLPMVERQILINGGAGVANKNFITPQGVMTKITKEELDILLNDSTFKRHVENGFITWHEKPADVEVVVADMERRDNSAPLVPEDFEEKAPTGRKKK